MPTGFLLIVGIVLFFIIFAAVRLAVEPLIQNKESANLKSGLSFLKDIGVLKNKEYKSIRLAKRNILKQLGCFTVVYNRFEISFSPLML
jgi:hypothetical protein